MAKITLDIDLSDMKVRISKGNIKLGSIPSFSTLPGNEFLLTADGEPIIEMNGTCGEFCSECKKDCYAVKMCRGRFRNKIVPSWAQNTALMRQDPDRVEREITEWVLKSKPAMFRYHTGGELESADQLRAYNRIAENCPDTKFYIYTKNTEALDEFFETDELKPNLAVNISQWHNSVENRHGLPEFIYDDGTDESLKSVKHCPAVDENGHETGITCIQCKRCSSGKKGQKTCVYAH